MSNKKSWTGWTAELVSDLISLYETNECLWNFHIEDYKNRPVREAAIRQICNSLDITKEQFSKKIHNLRNQFNFELKKELKRNNDDGIEYVCSWDYYERLQFLRDYIMHRAGYNSVFSTRKPLLAEEDTTDTETNRKLSTRKLSVTEYEIEQPEENESQAQLTPSLPRLEVNGQQYTSYIESHSEETPTPSTDRKNSRESFIRYVEQPVAKRTRIIDKDGGVVRDECDIFGDFVATEMRSLNSDISRRKLKRRIMQTILDVGNEDDGVNINISLN